MFLSNQHDSKRLYKIKAILGQKFIFSNFVKSEIRPIEKMCFQFINLEKMCEIWYC